MRKDVAPPLRLGLACTGWIADWAVHDPVRRGGPARVTFVASRDPARARAYAAAHGIRAAGGWAELLARDDVDAVYVATPNATHARLAREAVAAGKHVLCEKPLSRDPDEVDRLATAARRHGVLVREAFHYRWHDHVRSALDSLRRGALGPLRDIDVEFGWMLDRPGDPRLSASLHGGALMDVGCYGLDLAAELTGGPLRLEDLRVLERGDGPDGVDLTTEVSLASEHTAVRVRASLTDPRSACRARVTGSRGWVELDRVFLPVVPGDPSAKGFLARWHRGDGPPRQQPTGVGQPRPGSAAVTSYQRQLAGFVTAVRAGDEGCEATASRRARTLALATTQIGWKADHEQYL